MDANVKDSPPMERGRRALVTGASSGIGRATAAMLASRGYAVWLTYANDEAGALATADRCREDAADVRVSHLDLRDPHEISALWSELADGWGELHVLVNNGAICPYVSYEAIEVEEWDAVLETNARGTFLMIRAALPLLRATAGDRSVINVSSIAGQIGAVTTAVHYAASKAAILAITRSFARLLSSEGIRINAVAPGPIDSATTARLGRDARAALERAIPLGRFGVAAEVAAAITHLASPESSFTTGATYDVNGGVRID